MPYGTVNRRNDTKPKGRTDFGEILVQSVIETITEVLGQKVSESFLYYLQAYMGITTDEMPYRLETLFTSLEGSFGKGGETLGRQIVRKLYVKANMQLPDGHISLIENVENLKQRLAEREYGQTAA